MPELPLNTGACEWVSSTRRSPLSDVEQELVTILCAGLRTGPWNISANWRGLRTYGAGVRMAVQDGLSTTDFDKLTRLVFAAHDRACRISVNPAGPRMIEVCCWKRTRDADISHGHPTLEQAVTNWRGFTTAIASLPDVGTTAPNRSPGSPTENSEPLLDGSESRVDLAELCHILDASEPGDLPALPATIPGLLRRGSPVLTPPDVWPPGGELGVMMTLDPLLVASRFGIMAKLDPTQIRLDLTDATGRAHAAWWLASKLPKSQRPRHNPIESVGWIHGSIGWLLAGDVDHHYGWCSPACPRGMGVGWEPVELGCLAGLDIKDDRRLPDGSRFVDTEALRRVCLWTAIHLHHDHEYAPEWRKELE